MLPGSKFFRYPTRCGHWGFHGKCVSRCLEVTLRNGDGLGEESAGAHRREESLVFHWDLLYPLGTGTEGEGRPQQVETGGWIWKRMDVKMLSYLLHWLICFSVSLAGGSWGKPARVWGLGEQDELGRWLAEICEVSWRWGQGGGEVAASSLLRSWEWG